MRAMLFIVAGQFLIVVNLSFYYEAGSFFKQAGFVVSKKFVMLRRIIFFACLAGYGVLGTSCTHKVSPYNKKWIGYLNAAKEKNDFLIVEFYTDWCMPCKTLKREVLQNVSVRNYLNRESILISVNAEKGMGIPLAMKYGITSYPTLLVFSPSGILIYDKAGTDGIDTPATFMDFMKNIFHGKDMLPAKGFTTQLPSAKFYPAFYSQYFLNKKQPDTNSINNYFKKQFNLFSEINWTVARVFSNDSIQDYIIKNINKYIDLYGCTVRAMMMNKIQSSLNKDFKTKDSSQFKKDVEALFRMKEDVPKEQLDQKEFQIKLHFWAESGLSWNNFLLCWEQYRSIYGSNLDIDATKEVNMYYEKKDLTEMASHILTQDLRKSPHDWRIITGLANLIEKDKFLSTSPKNSDLLNHFGTNSTSKINLDPDSLFQQAMKEAKGDKETISLIVGQRINGALQISNDTYWQETMSFFKQYLPDAYKSFHIPQTATYYEKRRNWKMFTQYTNIAFNQLFINSHENLDEVNDVNAHFLYQNADIIYRNSNDSEQIRTAIDWMRYLSKKFPQDKIYKDEETLLKEKKESVENNRNNLGISL